jgi:hypothetical protein
MSAYNWVKVNEAVCPRCGASGLRGQTHIASSYAGDKSGRFFDRTYELGEQMAWWATDDPRYPEWKPHNGWTRITGPGQVAEWCHLRCPHCEVDSSEQFEYFAIVEFQPLKPLRVTWWGPAEESPQDFWDAAEA